MPKVPLAPRALPAARMEQLPLAGSLLLAERPLAAARLRPQAARLLPRAAVRWLAVLTQVPELLPQPLAALFRAEFPRLEFPLQEESALTAWLALTAD